MEFLKYINGVLFIDDKRDDIDNLYQYFESFNVPCMYINPVDYNGEANSTVGCARLVFLDLEYMPGGVKLTDVVSLLRNLSEKGMKNVILIMWTLHDDYVDDLLLLLEEKMKKEKPILIFNANKSEFTGLTQEEYTYKLNKMFQEAFEQNPLIFKLLEWEKSVNIATYKTFNEILAFSYNTESKTFDLPLALSIMASQNIPDNKISSALNVANDLLIDKIKNETEQITDYPLTKFSNDELLKKLNFHLMFLDSGLEKTAPGNIYKLEEPSSKIDNIMKNISFESTRWFPVLIDMTPACSFAHSKNLVLLNGLICEDITDNDRKSLLRKNDIDNFRGDVFLKDIYINENDLLCCLIIDCFGIEIKKKDEIGEMPIMRLKDNYRINLQQKFGNYLGRIGDNVYHKN